MIVEKLSPYLLTIFIAWLSAHVIKYTISIIKGEKKSLLRVFDSGGMPSAHSASVTSLATIVGLCDGFGSAIFGLSVLFALITMHDAMRVRRSSGEQGIAIKEIIKEQRLGVKTPKISKGHTPIEVVFGAIFGIGIGVVVFLSTL